MLQLVLAIILCHGFKSEMACTFSEKRNYYIYKLPVNPANNYVAQNSLTKESKEFITDAAGHLLSALFCNITFVEYF